jgi:hypothetical protein
VSAEAPDPETQRRRWDPSLPPLPGEIRLQVGCWSVLGFLAGAWYALINLGARNWPPVLLRGLAAGVIVGLLAGFLRTRRFRR